MTTKSLIPNGLTFATLHYQESFHLGSHSCIQVLVCIPCLWKLICHAVALGGGEKSLLRPRSGAILL